MEFGNLGVGIRLQRVCAADGADGGRDRLQRRGAARRLRGLLQNHQEQGRGQRRRAARYRANAQINRREVAIGLDAQTRCAHDILAGCGLVQAHREVATQTFTRHFQNVVDAGLALRRLQVHAGAPVQVKYVSLAIDQRRGQRELLQQGLLGKLAQRALGQVRRFVGGGQGRPVVVHQRRQKPAQRSALGALKIFLALVDLGLALQHGKQVALFARRLRRAQEQHAARLQGIVKQRDQLLLQFCAQVNQQVAATDQVELGERRVLDHVLLREHQQVTNAFVDPVGAAVGLEREKSGQPLRRHVVGDAGRVHTGTGHGDGAAVDVGGKHLHLVAGLEQLQPFLQQDGHRISLFTGGTTSAPDPHRAARRLAFEQFGNDLFLQCHKRVGVAEKMGHANQQVIEQGLDFHRGLLQVLDITGHRLNLVHRHAALDAAVNGAGLVLRKIVPGLGPQQDEDIFQCAAVGGGQRTGRVWQSAQGMGDISHELRRHFGGWQFKVHQAGGQRALWHAIEFSGGRALHHHHAALRLDFAHPLGSVAAGAREHDTDGALLLVRGQRGKQKVDRQAVPARCGGLQQLQRAIEKSHVTVGRNDVDAVGLHHHAIDHLKHLHAGAALDQFGEQALVVGVKVLHQHKGHAGLDIAGHAGEKCLDGRQAAGRGPDANDGKGRWPGWRHAGWRGRLPDFDFGACGHEILLCQTRRPGKSIAGSVVPDRCIACKASAPGRRSESGLRRAPP